MALVSIVMPTYNGARYLKESLDSCLQQTYQDVELIVVVDSRTTDTTHDILAQYADARLKVIVAQLPGQAVALNQGFAMAAGEFFSWTHDDNSYLPLAIEQMVTYLQHHSECHMVLTKVVEIDCNGKTLKDHSDLVASFLYRKSAAHTIGDYDARFDLVHDSHYWFRMAHHFGAAAWIEQDLYRYRKHEASRTSTQGARRALVSLNMHCDLYEKSYYPYSVGAPKIFGTIKKTFYQRLGSAALHKDFQAMQEMVELAIRQDFEWAGALSRRAQWYHTPVGWMVNRLRYALRGILLRMRNSIGC